MCHNYVRVLGRVIANDVLKMRQVIEFLFLSYRSSWIAIYYKIHFRVLLQPICAGEVSLVIVIDKEYNLVSSPKGNTMVKKKENLKCPIFHVFYRWIVTFSDSLQNFWAINYSAKIANGNMSRMCYTKVNFPT